MTTSDIAVPSTGRPGQSTQIEQARAMAQVHAMMRMAKEFPRDPSLALTRMRDACGQMELAERAFFRFSKGGKQVSGPSVHLARELARCWGNIDFGVSELARDDYKLESEMLAQAWDIETNTRTYAGFILPHKRDVGGGTAPLYTMREIYENNANAGARRLRECIFAVLPLRFCKEAQDLCNKTLGDENSETPLSERVEQLINWYASKGVKQDQLVDKIGKPVGHWTAGDVAVLRVIMHSLHANETTIDLEFPHVFLSAKDIPAGPVTADTAARVEQAKPGKDTGEPVQWSKIRPEATGNPALDMANAVTAATINSLAGGEPMPATLTPPKGYHCDVCNTPNADHFQDVCPGPADGTDPQS